MSRNQKIEIRVLDPKNIVFKLFSLETSQRHPKNLYKDIFNPKTPFYKFENPKSNRIKTKFTTPGLIILTCLNGKVTFIRPSLRET